MSVRELAALHVPLRSVCVKVLDAHSSQISTQHRALRAPASWRLPRVGRDAWALGSEPRTRPRPANCCSCFHLHRDQVLCTFSARKNQTLPGWDSWNGREGTSTGEDPALVTAVTTGPGCPGPGVTSCGPRPAQAAWTSGRHGDGASRRELPEQTCRETPSRAFLGHEGRRRATATCSLSSQQNPDQR